MFSKSFRRKILSYFWTSWIILNTAQLLTTAKHWSGHTEAKVRREHNKENSLISGRSATVWSLKASWNAMAHTQKPDFVFRRNGRVHLNRQGRKFSRLLAAEVCASEVVMVDTPCSEVVWRVLATHSIRQFPLHLLSRASPCAATFQLESTTEVFLSDVRLQEVSQYNYRVNIVYFPLKYIMYVQI